MATQNRFLILLILGGLTTISPFSIDMYLPAFQQMADQFGTTVTQVALSLSSYFVGLALGQLFYGPFLDRYGRKRPLYFGLGLYLLASVACLWAPSIEILIALRFFQAVGGCSAQVAWTAMVGDFYPPEESSRVFSKLMLILSVSPLFAPTVGGLVASSLGWGAIFIFLAGIVSLILVSVIFVLPEGHAADASISLSPKAIGIEYIAIFRNPQFRAHALSGAFSFSGLFAYLACASAIFMGKFHLSAQQFGFVFAGLSIGMVGGGQVNIFLSRWFTIEKIFRNAMVSQLTVGGIFLIGAVFNLYGLLGHTLLFFLYFASVGLTYPNAATLSLAPFERNRGSASALLGFLQMGIGAIASAIFGALVDHFTLGPSIAIGILFVATGGLALSILIFLKKRLGVSIAGSL